MMSNKKYNPGFTLVELLVVVAIVALVATFVLPNMDAIMGGESREQTMNLIDAKLRVARSMAIRNRNFVGVHFQRHYQTGDMWCAIVTLSEDPLLGRHSGDNFDSATAAQSYSDPYDASDPRILDWTYTHRRPLVRVSDNGALDLLDGSSPSRLPGNWRAGVVCSRLGDGYEDLYNASFVEYCDFDSFTIMFDNDGKAVHFTKQSPWNFISYTGSRFYVSKLFDGNSDEKIWDLPRKTDTIVNAFCLYDGLEFDMVRDMNNDGSNEDDQSYYLDENAAFHVVSPCVGGVIRSAVK